MCGVVICHSTFLVSNNQLYFQTLNSETQMVSPWTNSLQSLLEQSLTWLSVWKICSSKHIWFKKKGKKKGSTQLQELFYQLTQIRYSPWLQKDKQGKNRIVKLCTRIRKAVNIYTSYMHTCHLYKWLWHFKTKHPWFFKETVSSVPQELQKVLPKHYIFSQNIQQLQVLQSRCLNTALKFKYTHTLNIYVYIEN